MKAILSALGAGVLFSLGLGVGGMTDPANVQGFLDIAGDWDPGLAFVMAGALGTHALLRRFILRRATPVVAPAFPSYPATASRVDRRLVVGAGVFGVGWGLGGYCPGPSLTSVATGGSPALTFVLSMLGGMFLFSLWDRAKLSEDVDGALAAEHSGASSRR
ncbi:MAG: DUF6691 family protein [Myxococcaceae bacterium]